MTVIDTFINYADRICKDENVFEIYQELEKYMAEAEPCAIQGNVLH